MSRKYVLYALVLAWWTTVGAAPARAADRLDAEQIKAGLRTTSVEEQGFVDRVMINVDRGKVPRKLVESVFDWAKRKASKRKFQYFKYGLIKLAKRLGIEGVDVIDTD